MKTLREDVRQRILTAARDEFLLSGYGKASMRAIAAQAGMTVGNIYLYFAGKAQLFDALIEKPLEQLHALLRMSSASEESLHKLVDGITYIFVENHMEFLILVTRSEGSKYESFKENIVVLAQRRLAEEFPGETLQGIYAPVSVAMIEGILYMFHHFDGDEKRLKSDLLAFLNYMLRNLSAPQETEAMICKK